MRFLALCLLMQRVLSWQSFNPTALRALSRIARRPSLMVPHLQCAHVGAIDERTRRVGPEGRDCLHWCVAPGVLDALALSTLAQLAKAALMSCLAEAAIPAEEIRGLQSAMDAGASSAAQKVFASFVLAGGCSEQKPTSAVKRRRRGGGGKGAAAEDEDGNGSTAKAAAARGSDGNGSGGGVDSSLRGSQSSSNMCVLL